MGSHTQEQETSQNSKQEQDLSNKPAQDNTRAGRTFYKRRSSEHAGHLWKKFTITINDGSEAQFLAKLKYDSLTKRQFFKKMVSAYLNDNLIMRNLILDVNQEKISKSKKKKMLKEQKEQKEIIYNFALDENEIYDIFDTIEKENPDI